MAVDAPQPPPVTHEPFSDLGVPRVVRFSDLLSALAEDATAAYDAAQAGVPRGPITGLPKLDRILGGAMVPGLHMLHAAPGLGKSALALQIAEQGTYPALLISAEMSPLELLRRTIARVEGTFLGRLKSGELHPNEIIAKARAVAATVPLLAIADATRHPAPRSWIEANAILAFAGHPTGLLVVDSLHSWADAFDAQLDEYTRLASALKALRAIASTLKCPILVVCERNRSSMKSGGLNAGAGHRGIEFGAETVMGLDTNEDDTKLMAFGETLVTLTVAKNRNGACGKVPLVFNGARQMWREA